MHHPIEYQLEKAIQINELLLSSDTMSVELYKSLLMIMPEGLNARLRLTPDRYLASRLAHLFEVTQVVLGFVDMDLNEELELESFEGLSSDYPEDCDVILRGVSTGTIYFIDVTATNDEQVEKEKKSKLKSLCFRYDNGHGNTSAIIHRFDPYYFIIDISLTHVDSNPESVAVKFIEIMTRKTSKTTSKVYEQVDKLYDNLVTGIGNTDFVSHLYKQKAPRPALLEKAKEAMSSNDIDVMISLLKNAKSKNHVPYVDSLRRLADQCHTMKKVLRYPAAKVSRHNDLTTALSSLKEDLLAYTLYVATTVPGRVVLMKKTRSYDVVQAFPTNATSKKILSADSGYVLAVKHVKGHIFTIKFSYDEMCPNLRRILLREPQATVKVPNESKASIEKCMNVIAEADASVNHMMKEMLSRNPDQLVSTIWDKVNSMCNLTSRDLGSVGIVSTNMLSKITSIIRRSYIGAALGLRYEVANCFAASLKSSSKGSNYYVGVNGTFDSVTITKMNSTQDSYRTKHYAVIGRSLGADKTSYLVKECKKTRTGVFRSEFYTMNANELVYDLKIPYVALSLITWDLENNLKNGKVGEDQIPDMISSNILHTLVNRDVFAQTSQQSRYFYMSAIGYGAIPSKITDKFDFFTPKYHWEVLYTARMIKMGLSLSIIRDAGSMSSVLVDGELPVVFPHTRFPCVSFNHAVSSMYYSNVFNKFRAFQEVSASICFNELDDENEIYIRKVREARQELVGFSKESEDRILKEDMVYLASDEFFKNELEFSRSLLKSKASRFRASCTFILAATRKHVKIDKTIIDSIYSDLNVSPIKACTMRGSMDHNPATDKRQAIRAASSILEELFAERGYDPDAVSKNPLLAQQFLDEVKADDKDYSIFTSVITQIGRDCIYRYRVTPKDQTGHREISVLNAVFRLGALFYETVSVNLAKSMRKYDLLENASKEIVFEDAVSDSSKQTTHPTVFFDNSDQKRWGPNHMLHFFSIMMLGALPTEPGLVKLLNMVGQKTFDKRAKFPESLIRLFNVRKARGTGSKEDMTGIGSAPLSSFYKEHYDDLTNQVYDRNFRYGMCQGIFHSTSSLFHGVMSAVQEDVLNSNYGTSLIVKIYVTSDDASRIFLSKNKDFLSMMIYAHNVIIGVGNLMNILRNDAKSAMNPHIAEFNSVFYKNGKMATPSIKQRVSKLDVGSGENHFQDFMVALSNASNYFAAGGSYSGSVILSILNLVMHTEQWNRWEFCNATQFYKPVELGGFPVVEPFTSAISGAISNCYLRSADFISAEDYSKIYVSNITSKPEEFNLADFSRSNSNNISEDNKDLKILRNAGPMGLFSMLRTDRKLSMFDRRNKMSKWIIPDEFASLKKNRPSASNFIFNVSRTADMTLHDTPEGINSFYIRYTDPWVSSQRRIMKISKSSALKSFGYSEGDVITYSDIKTKLLTSSFADSKKILETMAQNVAVTDLTRMLVTQLTIKMDDAKTILSFISNQECETFIKPTTSPSVTRLTLKGTSVSDRNTYTQCMVKYLAGEKARFVITEMTGNSKAFDRLPSDKIDVPLGLKDSIVLADNCLNVFDKYVKSSTKMICSGRPSDLSSVITLILSNRFTESAGVRVVGKLRIPGDALHTFAYTGWYRDLSVKSKQNMNSHVKATLNRTYAEVVKYGVLSQSGTITSSDDFELTENVQSTKTVLVNSSKKADLSRLTRDWSVANVVFNFTHSSLEKLFLGSLTSRNEYLTSRNTISKICFTSYIKMEVNFKQAIHIMETTQHYNGNKFRHVFLVPSTNNLIITKAERSSETKGSEWVDILVQMILDNPPMKFGDEIVLGNDSYVFYEIDQSTRLRPVLLPGTMTCALKRGELILPITHAIPSDITEIRLAESIDHNNIVRAALVYKDLSDKTSEFKNFPVHLKKFFDSLLFKTSYLIDTEFFQKQCNSAGAGHLLMKELDILKAMLVSDNNLDVTISPSKLYNTINNLAIETPSMHSYLSSIQLGSIIINNDDAPDTMVATLADFMDPVEYTEDNDDIYDDDSVELDSEGLSIELPGLDDEDFDMEDLFMGDDEDDLDDLLEGLNRTAEVTSGDDAISRSVRTNHSLNPVDQYPSEILKLAHEWLKNTSVKVGPGFGFKMNSILDVLKYYTTLAFTDQKMDVDLIEKFYSEKEIRPVLPMAILAAIDES